MTVRPAATLSLYLRSLGAVVAGLVFVIFFSASTDELMHSAGVIPRGPMWDPAHNLLALGYRCLIGMGGGFVTAGLAPRTPMRHVAILGMIGTLAAVAGVMVTWPLNLGPHWYPIALAVTAFPSVWLGGWFYLQRARRLR